MTVHSIVAEITSKKRRPSEGVWVQGGGIELQVLCLWTEETQDPIILRQTKNYMCTGYCIVLPVLEENFQVYAPGDLYSEGRCKGGFFCVSRLAWGGGGGLILMQGLCMKGLFSDFYGICCFLKKPY